MPHDQRVTVTLDDAATQRAKALVQLGIVRSFNAHYAVGRAISNAAVVGAGYLMGGWVGALVATGAELVNQTVRSHNFPAALSTTRTTLIDRHWQKLSRSNFADKVAAALRPAARRAPALPLTAFPEPLRREFQCAAWELGLRHSSIGPVYMLARRHRDPGGPTPR